MIIAWIEIIVLIIKIVILSAIYSSILLALLFVIFKRKKNNFLKKLILQKLKLWLFFHLIISIFLFQYRFTYLRDTGLGENLIIPIGYEQCIENADGEMTYFFPDLKKTQPNRDEVYIEDFIISNKKICAEISSEHSNNPVNQFIIYDLQSKNIKEFNEEEYISFASKYNLPHRGEFYDFKKHYYEYIDTIPKWKKLLLP